MGEKRERQDSYGGNRQSYKKHKSNDNHGRNGAPRHASGPNGSKASSSYDRQYAPSDRHDKTNPVLRDIASLPEPKSCPPCKQKAADMQTGMIALLAQLVHEEAGSQADKDILHHARALHQLLLSRATKALPSQPRKDLDSRRPETVPVIQVPPYIERKVNQAKALPPLPPITEPYLQEAVFTHSSANDSKTLNTRGYRAGEINYERLEFLGDAYIETIASRLLYSRFPDIEPSHLCHLRENLVKNETLGQLSAAYGLGDRLKHGAHTAQSKNWTKVLADVFEAYVAAIILSDGETGYNTAEKWLIELWSPKLLEFKVKPIENPRARDEINKLLMAKGIKLDYREERDMIMVQGKQKYFIGLYLTGWGFEDEWLGSGEGQNKSQACVFAAMDALKNRMEVIKVANARKLEVYPPKPKESAEEEKGGKEKVDAK